MFAIADIETTGGFAAAARITEIAIFIYDGEKIVDQYTTLINPGTAVPRYIQALTGISSATVASAPAFEDVAEKIMNLLEGKIFVAHNVNFDFSFLRHQLEEAGYLLQVKKLCTVRLSRQLLPGLASYSLGNLCRHLQIPVQQRHRAFGDAEATVKLFTYLLQCDSKNIIQKNLLRGSREQYLPVNLPKQEIDDLPVNPGVYYFHNNKDKVIYVGKAKNIRHRVISHFTAHNISRQRQEFLRSIYHISFQICATELIAFILESVEIKKLWPAYNRSQKSWDQLYALYSFIDQNCYQRLVVEKWRKHLHPLHTFQLLTEGQTLLRKLIRQFNLCAKLCFLQTNNDSCAGIKENICYGACEKKEPAESYNQRVLQAINYLQNELPTFAIIDSGRKEQEKSCLLMEQGKFYGMGYIHAKAETKNKELLKNLLTPYPDNPYIRNLMNQYAAAHPATVYSFQ